MGKKTTFWRKFQGRLTWLLGHKLIVENIELCCRHFLNGVQIWQYYESDAFNRIGQYVGHGLCYEAAVLEMLMRRDDPTARYCLATCWLDTKREYSPHAWVEFKRHGLWWAIDPTWFAPAPMPRFLHNLGLRAHYDRIIKSKEFWSHLIARQTAERLVLPQSSYLFHELSFFRRAHRDGTLMLFEKYHIEHLHRNSGVGPTAELFGIHGDKHPLSHRMILRFLTHERSKLPHRHDYRRARRLTKTCDAALAEAKRLTEETGVKHLYAIDSASTYHIEKSPA